MVKFNVKYEPPGPISHEFYEDMSVCSMIMGPIGSAKTSTALMKFVLRAMAQRKSPIDGVRYSKWCVIRDTYRNLKKTTIPSWLEWMPKSLGTWVGGGNEPAVHTIRFNIAPPGEPVDIVHMIVEFIGLGEQTIEAAMRGWQGTGAYLNEADTLTKDVLTYVRGRVGRFPRKLEGGPSWYGVWCDMNAPDEENWAYDTFIDNLPETYKFFRQPGGLEKGAENLENLPPGYYENQIDGQEDWYVRRFIHNLIGYSRDGKPVFPEFNDVIHIANAPLLPLPGLPIHVGYDQGRTPAAIFGQQLGDGRWRILQEFCGLDMGAATFGKAILPFVAEKFPNHSLGSHWADPAAALGSDHDETCWLDIVKAATAYPLKPSPVPGNNLTDRFEAVRSPLGRLVDGKPGILISPACKTLRKGMNSGYRYKRIAKSGSNSIFQDVPEKTAQSHICEALQYLLCGGGEHMALKGRQKKMGKVKMKVAKSILGRR